MHCKQIHEALHSGQPLGASPPHEGSAPDSISLQSKTAMDKSLLLPFDKGLTHVLERRQAILRLIHEQDNQGANGLSAGYTGPNFSNAAAASVDQQLHRQHLYATFRKVTHEVSTLTAYMAKLIEAFAYTAKSH